MSGMFALIFILLRSYHYLTFEYLSQQILVPVYSRGTNELRGQEGQAPTEFPVRRVLPVVRPYPGASEIKMNCGYFNFPEILSYLLYI